MVKLNNKGFAISTMLYGILAMIILILYLILSIMNSGLDAKKQMVDDEEKYINKCANRQVALEKCFKTYNYTTPAVSCSEEYDAYTSCMGYEANSVYSSSTATIKEAVLDYADVYGITEGTSTLVYDESRTGENRYVFVGSNPNNYIRIGSKTGRIMSIESNGVAKVIMLDPVISKIDTESGAGITGITGTNVTAEMVRWERSVAYNKLYQEYLKLEYTNKMVDHTFDIGLIESNPSPAQSLLEMYTDAGKSKFNSVYGTLTIEDYLKASANAHDHKYNCKETGYPKFTLSQLNNNGFKCNSLNWISNLTGSDYAWTSTPANNLDTYYVIHGTKVETAAYNTAHKLFLVVCLSSKLTVNTSGDGTEANPYVISLK